MTYWSLEKDPAFGYFWRGESCWGGGDTEGYWMTRNDALMRKPFGAGNDWWDNTGDPKDAPREYEWSINFE